MSIHSSDPSPPPDEGGAPALRRVARMMGGAWVVAVFASCAARPPTAAPVVSQVRDLPAPAAATRDESPKRPPAPESRSVDVASAPRPDADAASGRPAYRIAYHFAPGEKRYLIVENEFRDHGGVPALLTFSTRVADRRSIIQTVLPPDPAMQPDKGESPFVRLLWECDRYEVREKGMTGEVSFDSLRDLYPLASLRQLGTIPGSKVTFSIHPETGRTRSRRLTPGPLKGPPVKRSRLSSTARRCALTDSNLRNVLDSLGPLFLPKGPVHVGDTWTNTRVENMKTFGRALTDYTFTLTDVREMDGRKIATIDVGGRIRLEKPSGPETKTSPGGRSPKRPKLRDGRIDRATCNGLIEFDLTRGELVRLTLRRELDLSTVTEAKGGKRMTLEKGASHVFRVEVHHRPPPKPVIVGGPQPPEVHAKEAARGSGKARPQRVDVRKRRDAVPAARRRKLLQPTGNPAPRTSIRPSGTDTAGHRASSQPTRPGLAPENTFPSASQPARRPSVPVRAGTPKKPAAPGKAAPNGAKPTSQPVGGSSESVRAPGGLGPGGK